MGVLTQMLFIFCRYGILKFSCFHIAWLELSTPPRLKPWPIFHISNEPLLLSLDSWLCYASRTSPLSCGSKFYFRLVRLGQQCSTACLMHDHANAQAEKHHVFCDPLAFPNDLIYFQGSATCITNGLLRGFQHNVLPSISRFNIIEIPTSLGVEELVKHCPIEH